MIREILDLETGSRLTISELYDESGLFLLTKRRGMHVLKKLFNIANNLSPSYLSNIVCPRELP